MVITIKKLPRMLKMMMKKIMMNLMRIKRKIMINYLAHQVNNKSIKRLMLFWVGDLLRIQMTLHSLELCTGIDHYLIIQTPM